MFVPFSGGDGEVAPFAPKLCGAHTLRGCKNVPTCAGEYGGWKVGCGARGQRQKKDGSVTEKRPKETHVRLIAPKSRLGPRDEVAHRRRLRPAGAHASDDRALAIAPPAICPPRPPRPPPTCPPMAEGVYRHHTNAHRGHGRRKSCQHIAKGHLDALFLRV